MQTRRGAQTPCLLGRGARELAPDAPTGAAAAHSTVAALARQQAIYAATAGCALADEQGFDQQSFCTSSSSSLFEDFSCSRNVIPRETHHTLEKHSDEVWYVQFSHNGELLASASKDNMVIVWDVRRTEMTHLVVRPCPAASTCAHNRRTTALDAAPRYCA